MAADASINCKFPWVWKYRKNGMFCETKRATRFRYTFEMCDIYHDLLCFEIHETTCSNHVQTIILRVIVNLHRVRKCTSENWSKEKWIWEKHARNLIISNSYMIKVSVYCNALPTRTLHEANYSECVPSKIHVCHNGVEAPEQTQETDFLHLLGKSWKITGLPPAMPQETWPCFYVPQVSVFPHKSNKGNTCPAWSSEHYDPVTATAVTGLWKETPFTTASCVQNMLRNQENSRSLEWLIKVSIFLFTGIAGIAHHFVHKESKPLWLAIGCGVVQPTESDIFYIWQQTQKTAAMKNYVASKYWLLQTPISIKEKNNLYIWD